MFPFFPLFKLFLLWITLSSSFPLSFRDLLSPKAPLLPVTESLCLKPHKKTSPLKISLRPTSKSPPTLQLACSKLNLPQKQTVCPSLQCPAPLFSHLVSFSQAKPSSLSSFPSLAQRISLKYLSLTAPQNFSQSSMGSPLQLFPFPSLQSLS